MSGHETDNELFNALLTEIVEDIKNIAVMDVEDMLGRCESPIERRLAIALAFMRPDGGYLFRVGWHPDFYVHPQFDCGPYRLDFAIMSKDASGITDVFKIAVECDGHDFHERTKAQAAHDKRRDRYFTLNGWHVLRFTGAEIWRDPRACVEQISQLIVRRTFAYYDIPMPAAVLEHWAKLEQRQ